MPGSALLAVRILLALVAIALLAAGMVLGYIAAFAIRRGEGVFLPAGYVALACFAASYFLLRHILRG